jgi:hypothetical protein
VDSFAVLLRARVAILTVRADFTASNDCGEHGEDEREGSQDEPLPRALRCEVHERADSCQGREEPRAPPRDRRDRAARAPEACAAEHDQCGRDPDDHGESAPDALARRQIRVRPAPGGFAEWSTQSESCLEDGDGSETDSRCCGCTTARFAAGVQAAISLGTLRQTTQSRAWTDMVHTPR